MGIRMDKLTREQKKYLSSWEMGDLSFLLRRQGSVGFFPRQFVRFLAVHEHASFHLFQDQDSLGPYSATGPSGDERLGKQVVLA